jgi:hypothetical protein
VQIRKNERLPRVSQRTASSRFSKYGVVTIQFYAPVSHDDTHHKARQHSSISVSVVTKQLFILILAWTLIS